MLKRIFALVVFLAVPIFASTNGSQTVVTAGVPVPLLATGSVSCTIVTIQAKSGNSGTIWVGFGPTVSAANGYGVALGPPTVSGQPGGSYGLFPAGNTYQWKLSLIYLDATHSGDSVSFTCY